MTEQSLILFKMNEKRFLRKVQEVIDLFATCRSAVFCNAVVENRLKADEPLFILPPVIRESEWSGCSR